jgi:hypothetical protein
LPELFVVHAWVMMDGRAQIDRHLKRVCDSDFTESKIAQCEGWLEATVLPWIAIVCGGHLSSLDVVHPCPADATATGWEPIDDGSGGISGASRARGEATLFAHINGCSLPDTHPHVSPLDARTQLWERRVRLHLYEVGRITRLHGLVRTSLPSG